jgi:hypothetical protein
MTQKSANHFYRVLVSCPENGFELAEHLLSKQLMFVFENLPDLEFASKLEATGFAHMFDEHIFTIDATPSYRNRAIKLATEYKELSRGR